MKEDDIKLFLGKRVTIYTNDGLYYSGSIREIRDNSIYFTDRYNATLLIALGSIAKIVEARI